MSSGSYYEEEMSSGGHRRLTAFILWPFPLSKKSPLDPPSPWSWLGAYLQTLRRRYKVKKRKAPPSQPICSSGALRSVGCFGCAKSRLSSVIAQKQMCAKYRTLPFRVSAGYHSSKSRQRNSSHFPGVSANGCNFPNVITCRKDH